MALEAAMQRRVRQMRDGRLQSVKAIIERQQRMPSKGDDHGLLLDGVLVRSVGVAHIRRQISPR